MDALVALVQPCVHLQDILLLPCKRPLPHGHDCHAWFTRHYLQRVPTSPQPSHARHSGTRATKHYMCVRNPSFEVMITEKSNWEEIDVVQRVQLLCFGAQLWKVASEHK